jgi:hypothetical protein
VNTLRERLEGLTAEGLLAALLDAPARDRAFFGALAADRLEELSDARAAGLRLAAGRGWWPELRTGTEGGPHPNGSWDWRQQVVSHAVFDRLAGGWRPSWTPGYREYPSGPAAMLALLAALKSLPPEDFARLQKEVRVE